MAIKIGVMGGFRGTDMINYCEIAENAEVVAICDKNEEVLNAVSYTHLTLPTILLV